MREVGVDKLLGVCQEEVITELRMPGPLGVTEAGAAHRVHQPPVTLEDNSNPVMETILSGETCPYGVWRVCI